MKLIPPNKIYISESKIHGLGVFSNTTINEGEVIEECPIFDFKSKDNDICKSLLGYIFFWPLEKDYETLVFPWGYGNLYNHSDNPNCCWRSDVDKKIFVFLALRTINADEEITVNYGDTYWGN